MSILLHVVIKEIILFSQPRDELLWWDHANLLLLRGNAVEKVCQTRQQIFLLLLLGLVCQHVLTEWPAEVQCLEHGVTVACVSKIDQSKVVFIDWELLWADVFFQSGGIGALEEKNNISSVACETGQKVR